MELSIQNTCRHQQILFFNNQLVDVSLLNKTARAPGQRPGKALYAPPMTFSQFGTTPTV